MPGFKQASDLDAWKALQAHHNTLGRNIVLKDEFAKDPKRFEKFTRTFPNSVDGKDILFDFSKNFLTDETLSLLVNLAKEANVEQLRDAMFKGEHINFTEDRAVYHAALRNVSNEAMTVDGKSVVEGVNTVLEHMKEFTEQVRSGEWKGYTGQRVKTIINIGIGGSDLYEPVSMFPQVFEANCEQRPGHGHRSSQAVWGPQPDVALCLQHRRNSHRRGSEGV
jgi:glucose-6-phosphate isomerase